MLDLARFEQTIYRLRLGGDVMTVNWKESDHPSWRYEFKQLKGTISIEDLRLLDEGAKTMKDAWRLGALHAEYKRLKRSQPPDLPNLKR